jgi:hypothetical protein
MNFLNVMVRGEMAVHGASRLESRKTRFDVDIGVRSLRTPAPYFIYRVVVDVSSFFY